VSELLVVDEAEITRRYGIPGRVYVDFALLRGDPSDGLPGVPAPLPPVHTTGPENTRPVLARMFPVGTPPPEAFTVSLNPVTRIVS